MKLNRYTIMSIALPAILFAACTYDFPEADPATIPQPGTADFSKYISVGNSLTAGFMDGALYTRSQKNSFPSIIATQFAMVGGGEFNQPDVNSENGCYNASGGCTQGRLHFVYVNGAATILPKAGDGGAALAAYTGDKSKLNNWGVPGITIQTALTPLSGSPGNPLFNPYYARIASAPGTSTLIGDAAARLADGGTFFSFWLGNNDVLGYATGGASNPALLTSEAAFQGAYTTAINTMLSANANAKGVIANIPDVTSLPYFTRVPYNAIPLNANTAAAVNAGFTGYNQVLDAIKANPNLLAAYGPNTSNIDARKITFSASSSNRILIADESPSSRDFGGAFDALKDAGAITAAQRAALEPYRKVRQANASDLITLPASSVLGTIVNSNPQLVNGVTVPLADQFVLIPDEIAEIKNRTTAFNTIIRNAATTNSSRLALVDSFTILNGVKTSPVSVNGIGLTASFEPPYGMFSADGVHPNARGSAFMANKFLESINKAFSANIPLVNPNDYTGNDLPVNQ